uniref:BAG domain-containing protein n=1 Tax=Rhabditophanes sp. KR3021 TaxID=114890 RepID=A0AC35TGR1_9BILA
MNRSRSPPNWSRNVEAFPTQYNYPPPNIRFNHRPDDNGRDDYDKLIESGRRSQGNEELYRESRPGSSKEYYDSKRSRDYSYNQSYRQHCGNNYKNSSSPSVHNRDQKSRSLDKERHHYNSVLTNEKINYTRPGKARTSDGNNYDKETKRSYEKDGKKIQVDNGKHLDTPDDFCGHLHQKVDLKRHITKTKPSTITDRQLKDFQKAQTDKISKAAANEDDIEASIGNMTNEYSLYNVEGELPIPLELESNNEESLLQERCLMRPRIVQTNSPHRESELITIPSSPTLHRQSGLITIPSSPTVNSGQRGTIIQEIEQSPRRQNNIDLKSLFNEDMFKFVQEPKLFENKDKVETATIITELAHIHEIIKKEPLNHPEDGYKLLWDLNSVEVSCRKTINTQKQALEQIRLLKKGIDKNIILNELIYDKIMDIKSDLALADKSFQNNRS